MWRLTLQQAEQNRDSIRFAEHILHLVLKCLTLQMKRAFCIWKLWLFLEQNNRLLMLCAVLERKAWQCFNIAALSAKDTTYLKYSGFYLNLMSAEVSHVCRGRLFLREGYRRNWNEACSQQMSYPMMTWFNYLSGEITKLQTHGACCLYLRP